MTTWQDSVIIWVLCQPAWRRRRWPCRSRQIFQCLSLVSVFKKSLNTTWPKNNSRMWLRECDSTTPRAFIIFGPSTVKCFLIHSPLHHVAVGGGVLNLECTGLIKLPFPGFEYSVPPFPYNFCLYLHTASLSHLRTMLPESSSCPQPAQRPNHAT